MLETKHDEQQDEADELQDESWYNPETVIRQQRELYRDQPVSIEFHSGKMWVTLADGRTIGTPLAWYPFLMKATPQQREMTRLERRGIWWMELDEGLSIVGLLEGRQGSPKQLAAMWGD
ncbi:MAG: DUF2442 domain-containing protein, partial [Burkholderiales bacterium]|nr:DUF2442 domain-containing protein [Anaerolineae bacterium]